MRISKDVQEVSGTCKFILCRVILDFGLLDDCHRSLILVEIFWFEAGIFEGLLIMECRFSKLENILLLGGFFVNSNLGNYQSVAGILPWASGRDLVYWSL